MNPALEAFFRSWPYNPGLVVAIVVCGAIYLRGWRVLRSHDPIRWHRGCLAAFWGGLLAVFVALASPIESFAMLLLQLHMLQHMLLLIVAPPLIWLSRPLLPLLRGLPRPVRIRLATPVLRSPLTRDLFSVLMHPVVAWSVMAAVIWLWHTPRGYELALTSATWHKFEHGSFVVAALLFWFPVVAPFPSRPTWTRWGVVPYLILADVQNTVLAAWLTFASEPLYPHYREVPRVGGWSALADQQAAGVLMWVPGSIAFLLPVCVIGWRMLTEKPEVPRLTRTPDTKPLPILIVASQACACSAANHNGRTASWDLLDLPVLGQFLRRRGARRALQFGMLALTFLVILDGLLGPQIGPANLAGVAPWIHWRGLIMFGLLIGGNVFCLACPFTLPRHLARHWLPPGRSWPRVLRSKWLAVALVVLFLWSYEAFSLWNSPWLTAWIAIAYFVAAFAVDGLFRGAAFCKYVCPIGQFNFVQSLVSPLEVAVRDSGVCVGCQSKECIRGGASHSGCGMHLFQPRKAGNLDCTFCLDCIHACPHENVGVLARFPGSQLADGHLFRSGVGRLAMRVDVAALVLLLVFGAFANAAGMVSPVIAWQEALRSRLGNPPLLTIVSGYYLLTIVVAPWALAVLAAAVNQWTTGTDKTRLFVASRYAFMFVPLGFAMWLAHHGFHFLTSYGTIVPATQRMAIDFGLSQLAVPQWQHACCLGVADWIVKLELLALDIGLVSSILVGYRIACREDGRGRQALMAMIPWAAIAILLFAIGVWIVLEPMQMRGTLPAGG